MSSQTGRSSITPKSALVIVFGDVGHSPRMINHVRELYNCGISVDLVGFLQSNPPKDILGADSNGKTYVKLHSIPICRMPETAVLVVRVLFMAIRFILQSVCILYLCLTRIRSPGVILVQSPPTLPTLAVAVLLKWWYHCKYIIDWHNVGYTLLAQKLPVPAILAIAKAVEFFLARFGDDHLVVSQSQKTWMQANVGVSAQVYYDRPSKYFRALHRADRKAVRERFRRRLGWESTDDTIPLLISSTSWTPDEDFDMFVDALEVLETTLTLPIHMIVTGKGPLRQKYEERILSLHLRHIHFSTTWLSYEEYSELLGAADYGICLHVSSSGVDLPMKAVDMLGSGLPVIARNYGAIPELVQDGQNGFIFESSTELADIIKDLLLGRKRVPPLPKLESCSDHWRSRVLPLLSR